MRIELTKLDITQAAQATETESSDYQVPQLADTTVVHAHVDPAGESSLNRVIIIDGMAVVNSITKSKEMKCAKTLQMLFCRLSVTLLYIMMILDWCLIGT